MTETRTAPAQWLVIAALGSIYVVWGSTYLGIRIAIDTIPLFLMAGTRFLLAGLLLLGWHWPRQRAGQPTVPPRPTLYHWRSATIVGALMLVGGNGGVTVAESLDVPTGLVALMIGAVPIWVTLLHWIAFGGARPTGRMAFGLAFGLSGLALLIGPSSLIGGESIDPLGALCVMVAALTWATGSLIASQAKLPENPLLGTGMEMVAGGVLLLLIGTVSGEWAQLDFAAISLESAISMVYLTFIGSLLAFSAYTWLLRNTTPTRASSYAYVNPVVAVFLGWLVLDEAITLRTMVAAGIIISAVVLITSLKAQGAPRAEAGEVAEAIGSQVVAESCSGK